MKTARGNLLIIDDEIELLESMKELLEEEAGQIFTARNGEEALSILAIKEVDCIVSDIKMPVMDGLKFMELARERGYFQPIIFFTGHGTENLKQAVKTLGAADLLVKPNFLLLELAIRKHMASRELDTTDLG